MQLQEERDSGTVHEIRRGQFGAVGLRVVFEDADEHRHKRAERQAKLVEDVGDELF